MKTIEKFADDYSKSAMTDYESEIEINGECNIEQLIKNAVINTVEFAQRWIPIEEELPEIEEIEYVVLTKFISPYGVIHYGSKYIKTEEDIDLIKRHFTHWRPIELK